MKYINISAADAMQSVIDKCMITVINVTESNGSLINVIFSKSCIFGYIN